MKNDPHLPYLSVSFTGKPHPSEEGISMFFTLGKNRFRIKQLCFSLGLLGLAGNGQMASSEEPGSVGLTPKNWDFYGSARVGGSYWHKDKWYREVSVLDSAGNIASKKTIVDTVPIKRLFMDLQYNSFFGATGKSDQLGFRFEVGWMPGVQDIDVQIIGGNASISQKRRDAVRLRRLYGEWNINDQFKLLVGQDWAITNLGNSNQIFFMDQGLGYSGALSTGRRPMVKLSYAQETDAVMTWKGELAVVKPDTSIISLKQPPEAEEKLPKIEIGGEFGFQKEDLFGVKLKGVAGMQQYDLVVYADKTGAVDADRQSVKSQVIGGNMELDFLKTTTSFNYAWGKNIATYGVWIGDPDGSKLDEHIAIFFPVLGTSDTTQTVQHLTNSFTRMGSLVFNYHPLKWFSAEAGGGMVLGRHEDLSRQLTMKSTLNAMKRVAYYANMQFGLADGKFLIVPEYSYSDFGGSYQAGRWYAYGLKLQMDM
jgi:hypothetical protein